MIFSAIFSKSASLISFAMVKVCQQCSKVDKYQFNKNSKP